MTAWSYSSIKTFDQCPKKYFHLKVIKDVKDDPGEAAIYGTDAHEAAEHYIKNHSIHKRNCKTETGTIRALIRLWGNNQAQSIDKA
jgi:hypothetical protein